MRLPMTPVAEASTNEKIRFATDASNSVDAIAGECRAADANRDAVTGVVRSPQVKAGQTLVSHGAAGNVGSYAAPICASRGFANGRTPGYGRHFVPRRHRDRLSDPAPRGRSSGRRHGDLSSRWRDAKPPGTRAASAEAKTRARGRSELID
jgi:hypothetical protein